jgi:hypothetical protein
MRRPCDGTGVRPSREFLDLWALEVRPRVRREDRSMNQHPRFAEIRAAAIAAFGTPDSDGESYGQHRVAWDRGGITLLGAAHYVYFVHPRTEGAWWVVDDATMKPTVTLADAINALRPIATASE